MLETDAPYCDIRPTHASYTYVSTHFTSVKKERHDGGMVKSRNEPCTVVQVAEVVAAIKGIRLDELKKICFENTVKVFPELA